MLDLKEVEELYFHHASHQTSGKKATPRQNPIDL